MHSSRMRTNRLLTRGGLHPVGSTQPGGICIRRALPNPGGSAEAMGGSASRGVCPTQGFCIGGSAGIDPQVGQTPGLRLPRSA